MSSFIRPELAQFFRRWREPIAASLLALLGLGMLWRGIARYNWMTEGIGLVLLGLGLATFWAGYRRAQFNRFGKGPGLIQVTERQISYMTSLGGGSVDIADITRLELRSTLEFGRIWVIKQSMDETMFIPVDAAGSEALFDAFSALPGMEAGQLVAAINKKGQQRQIVWRDDNKFRALT
jgi:hypothetical protein